MSSRSAGARRRNPQIGPRLGPAPRPTSPETIFGINPKTIVSNRESIFGSPRHSTTSLQSHTTTVTVTGNYPATNVSSPSSPPPSNSRVHVGGRSASGRKRIAKDASAANAELSQELTYSTFVLPTNSYGHYLATPPSSPPMTLRAPTMITFAAPGTSPLNGDSLPLPAEEFCFPSPSRSLGRPDHSIQPEFKKMKHGRKAGRSTNYGAKSTKKTNGKTRLGKFGKIGRHLKSIPEHGESDGMPEVENASGLSPAITATAGTEGNGATGVSQPKPAELFVIKDAWTRKQETTLHPYPSYEAPYPQSYDSAMLQNDLYTDILFSRLRPAGSPLFCDYGDKAPNSVLDLGCGPGLWVLHAAKVWEAHGSNVVGFDLVDLTKGVWPAVPDRPNFKLVRGNFLHYTLPFADESFDVVRMANLAFCIPHDKWTYVLGEAFRVLRRGGRLELIDDESVFPYARRPEDHQDSPSISPIEPARSLSPQSGLSLSSAGSLTRSSSDPSIISSATSLDSSRLSSSYSIAATRATSPSDCAKSISYSEKSLSTSSESTGTDSVFTRPSSPPLSTLSLSNTVYTLHTPPPTPPPTLSTLQRECSAQDSQSQQWDNRATVCEEFETLFENMLDQRLGIDLHPSEFLLEAISSVFGSENSSISQTFELQLAPPDLAQVNFFNGLPSSGDDAPPPPHDPSNANTSSPTSDSAILASNINDLPFPYAHLVTSPPLPKSARFRKGTEQPQSYLSKCPGLLLSHSTLIPLSPLELEKHVCKNVQAVLGCKSALADFVEIRENGESSFDEEFWDAFCEYQSFVQQRFEAPERAKEIDDDDTSTIKAMRFKKRGSVSSIISYEVHSYQNFFKEDYFWNADDEPEDSDDVDEHQLNTARPYSPPLVIDGPILEEEDFTAVPPADSGLSPKVVVTQAAGLDQDTDEDCPETPRAKTTNTGLADLENALAAREIERKDNILIPYYGPDDFIHVRTIRVYEAIKR